MHSTEQHRYKYLVHDACTALQPSHCQHRGAIARCICIRLAPPPTSSDFPSLGPWLLPSLLRSGNSDQPVIDLVVVVFSSPFRVGHGEKLRTQQPPKLSNFSPSWPPQPVPSSSKSTGLSIFSKKKKQKKKTGHASSIYAFRGSACQRRVAVTRSLARPRRQPA